MDKTQTNHRIELTNRTSCTMTGVQKVVSSSETLISIVTDCGGMDVVGKKLKISKFDVLDGSLCFDGEIDCMKYSAPKVPLLKRLFK